MRQAWGPGLYLQHHKKFTKKIFLFTNFLMKTRHLLYLCEVQGSILSTDHMYAYDLIYCDVDHEEDQDLLKNVFAKGRKYFNNL